MRSLSFVLVCVCLPVPAQADDPPADALVAFERGRSAYEAGRFDEAATEFERCFALSGEPDVLYNLANAYERLRRDVDALAAYRRFLAMRPDTRDRPNIESRIAILERTTAAAVAAASVEAADTEIAPVEASAPEPVTQAPRAALEITRDEASATSGEGPNVGAWTLIGTGACMPVLYPARATRRAVDLPGGSAGRPPSRCGGRCAYARRGRRSSSRARCCSRSRRRTPTRWPARRAGPTSSRPTIARRRSAAWASARSGSASRSA